MALSPGQILRQKREEKKLSLEQVSVETSIRIHYLQAIEEDRMGAISSQTQLRGFTRLYASYLGVDPKDLLEPSATVDTGHRVDVSAASPAKVKIPHVKKVAAVTDPQPVPEPEAAIPEKQSTAIFKEIGEDLKRQRESLGLSRFDIERQIKIRELYLFALENGKVEELPSTVQGRGMLNNYAAFMSLDPEPLQMRFAEGLQQRRVEQAAEELAKKKSPELKKFNAPITGWRRYVTPDLVIGVGIFIVLFVLMIWGATEMIGSSKPAAEATAESISSILIASETPTAETVTQTQESASSISTTPQSGDQAGTASLDLLATINAVGNKPIQVVVVAYQRAYLKVTSDGKDVYLGRVIPGDVYTFTGSKKITLVTGNAAALQIYYNQQELGILGSNGQVLNLDFTDNGMATSTPQYTAVPTATKMPTFTQQPTSTFTPTATEVVPTITPYKP